MDWGEEAEEGSRPRCESIEETFRRRYERTPRRALKSKNIMATITGDEVTDVRRGGKDVGSLERRETSTISLFMCLR